MLIIHLLANQDLLYFYRQILSSICSHMRAKNYKLQLNQKLGIDLLEKLDYRNLLIIQDSSSLFSSSRNIYHKNFRHGRQIVVYHKWIVLKSPLLDFLFSVEIMESNSYYPIFKLIITEKSTILIFDSKNLWFKFFLIFTVFHRWNWSFKEYHFFANIHWKLWIIKKRLYPARIVSFKQNRDSTCIVFANKFY